jgi:hypothetical protein
MAKKDKKERLKSIAKGRGAKAVSGDYSAKGLYMKRKGAIGKNAIDTKSAVTVTTGGRSREFTKGQALHADTPALWLGKLTDASADPALHAKAVAFEWTDGEVYNISDGKARTA